MTEYGYENAKKKLNFMIDEILRKFVKKEQDNEEDNEEEEELDLDLEVDYESYKTKIIIKLKLKYIVDCLEKQDRIHYYTGQFNRVKQHKFTKYVNDKRCTYFRPTVFGCRHNNDQNTIAY